MSTLAMLGTAIFESQGLNFQELHRNFTYRWHPMERLGRRPALQFLGPGEETQTIMGKIYPNDPRFAGSLSGLNQLRAASATGAFFNFGALSNGGIATFLGTWCVKSIRDENTVYAPNGQPSKVSFTIEISAYGADAASFGGFF